MPPVSYFTNTSQLQRPYRLRSPQDYLTPTAPNQPDDNEDPAQKLLRETAADNQVRPSPSTYGAELANRLKAPTATTSALTNQMPMQTSSVGASQQGFSNPYMQQLSQITKLGQLATQRVQAVNAYKNAQRSAMGGGGLGGLDLSGIKGARAKLIAAAKSQLGVPYVYGGSSPGKALDCSALVQYAYRKAGIRMPRVAAAQMTRGHIASIASLKPGDLVGWGHPAHHIAIYLGGGRVIEAPHTGSHVRIISLGRKGGGAWGIHLSI